MANAESANRPFHLSPFGCFRLWPYWIFFYLLQTFLYC